MLRVIETGIAGSGVGICADAGDGEMDGWMEMWKRPAHRGFDPSVIAAPENSQAP